MGGKHWHRETFVDDTKDLELVSNIKTPDDEGLFALGTIAIGAVPPVIQELSGLDRDLIIKSSHRRTQCLRNQSSI